MISRFKGQAVCLVDIDGVKQKQALTIVAEASKKHVFKDGELVDIVYGELKNIQPYDINGKILKVIEVKELEEIDW